MSLYTPVFPSVHESSSPRKRSAAAPGNKQSYVEFLRDVHLFLSTHSEMLSPPSRPNSPLLDHRSQNVRDKIQDLFNTTGSDTRHGKAIRLSRTLKPGCVRGRPWSVSKADPSPPEEDTSWILPDGESEWIEWEKKREESRRLRGKTNVSPQIGDTAPVVPDSQKPAQISPAESMRRRTMRERFPRGVSPATMRTAKEKVRKWQASVQSVVSHDDSPPAPTKAVIATTPVEGKAERSQGSCTLGFAVVKPATKLATGKKGKDLSRPANRTPLHKSESPKPSKACNVPQVTAPVDADKTDFKPSLKTSPVQDSMPKIADVPETPYFPPSFPMHLETSTPLGESMMLVRSRPLPIFPVPPSSSTPPPSTSANPPTNVSSSLPSQINTAHPGKRPREFSTSLSGIPDDPLVTPPTRRLRTLAQNRSTPATKHSMSMSSKGDLNVVPDTRDDARGPNVGAAPSHMNSLEMVSGAPSTPSRLVTGADGQGVREKIPSPTKSLKSYFSAPDSDPAESPVTANLLLESPVSPMLSYAQNASGFLPQITSTQMGKGSLAAGRTNGGIFGMGYNSQIDVERHVDRVGELLARDVDFDGWLQDVRMVETGHD